MNLQTSTFLQILGWETINAHVPNPEMCPQKVACVLSDTVATWPWPGSAGTAFQQHRLLQGMSWKTDLTCPADLSVVEHWNRKGHWESRRRRSQPFQVTAGEISSKSKARNITAKIQLAHDYRHSQEMSLGQGTFLALWNFTYAQIYNSSHSTAGKYQPNLARIIKCNTETY